MPETKEGQERRTSPRKQPSQGTVVESQGIARWFGRVSNYAPRHVMIDISEGGICFENHNSKRTFVPGDVVAFQVRASHLDPIMATGRVAWIAWRRKGAAKIQLVGVTFKRLPRWAKREIVTLS